MRRLFCVWNMSQGKSGPRGGWRGGKTGCLEVTKKFALYSDYNAALKDLYPVCGRGRGEPINTFLWSRKQVRGKTGIQVASTMMDD